MHESGHLEAVAEPDVRQCLHPAADAVLQVGPARQQDRRDRLRPLAEQVAADPEVRLGQVTDLRGAGLDQLGHQTREQLLDDLDAARLEAVHVPRLRHPAAYAGSGRQRVAVDQRHPCVLLAEHPGREQAGHPGAQDHRVAGGRPLGCSAHVCLLVVLTVPRRVPTGARQDMETGWRSCGEPVESNPARSDPTMTHLGGCRVSRRLRQCRDQLGRCSRCTRSTVAASTPPGSSCAGTASRCTSSHRSSTSSPSCCSIATGWSPRPSCSTRSGATGS